ncbi:VQ motif-containing protein 22-like [Humulus lupulus]|uniref:VQ motif-containing protein 22-like n=1 Tax=Humulus lupulus TaxID=3486 RepID=UPI002B4004DC|nr:VQ motif-containing protein 22-like [Humulus lupulus]
MSQKTLASSHDEWLQYYHQNLLDDEEPINHHDILSAVMSSESLGSPGSPSPTASHDPQQGCAVSTPSKPVRRRSRASKKTPTTLLNANANNFRTLVQQFTGCPTPISFANQKGPLNLNFGLKNATPMIEPFRNYNYRNQTHQPSVAPQQNLLHLQLQQQQQQLHQSYFEDSNYNQLNQVDQLSYSSHSGSTITSNGFFPSSSSMNASSTTPSVEISNGFIFEDDLSYQDFTEIFD